MDSDTSHRADTPPAFPVAAYGYAGFWKRAAAALIDGIITNVLVGLCMGVVAGLIRGAASQTGHQGAGLVVVAVGVVMYWLYFALFESSSKQATPGKMMVGIKITDAAGNRISFGRASGRHFGKILSASLLFIGYVTAAFTQKKRGLHDMLAGCLVVNKEVSQKSQTGRMIVAAVVAILIVPAIGILSAALFPAIGNAMLQDNMAAMGNRTKDIYVAIVGANVEREPLGLGSVWPKSGKKMEEGNDISKMRFENSSDYFTVLFDGERMGSPDWSPYVANGDYSKCAGAGVPKKMETGRLTAENNAWIIAANVTDDMPDCIPILITRNVDPASLIPREGDLREQYVRLSSEFKTPFGNKGFVMVRKGDAISHMRFARGGISLATIYQGADAQELQRIRAALQKVEYLAP